MKDGINKLHKVSKSNDLVESTYKLSLQEHRIIATLISMIEPSDATFQIYKFNIKDFGEMIGVKGKIYSYIKRIVTDLQEKTVEIPTENSTLVINWLASAEYFENEGYVELEISSKLRPYLLELKERFTSYQLYNILKLSSSYSIRIYELLKQIQFTQQKSRIIELQTLREWLGLIGEEEYKYKQYGHFKAKILKVAQREINNKADVYFDFEEIKKGRKVEKIKLIVSKHPRQSNDRRSINMFEHKETSALFDKINEMTHKQSYKVDVKTVQRWEQLAEEKWKDNKDMNLLFLIDEVNHTKGIENPIGYITSILQSKNAVKKVIRNELKPEWMGKDQISSFEKQSTEEEQRELKELLNKYTSQ